MAYKFQLGAARLGGNLTLGGDATLSGSLATTAIDDTTAANVVAQIDDKEIPHTKVALESANILIGDAGGTAQNQALSGDATLAGNGALTISANAVDNGKLAGMARGTVKVGNASGAASDLNAKTAGQILVGDGNDVVSVAVSGDATLSAAGALTIANNAVEAAMINTSVAGEGIAGGGGTALSVDLGEFSEAAIADGDYFAFIDATDGNMKKDAIADLATLYAGDGLVAASSVISLDLKANSGLAFDSGEVAVVVDSDALQLGASGIDLKDTIAGARTFSGNLTAGGNIDCDAGNISLFASVGANNTITIGHAQSTGSFAGALTVAGNLTVNGTTTTINSTELSVDDRIIRIGDGLANLAAGVTAAAGWEIGANLASFKLNTDVDGGGTDGFLSSLPIKASNFHGLADSATVLANARTIGGVSFNGSANIVPNTITILDEENTNADRLVMFADANGAQQPKNDGDFKYNPFTGKVTATKFAGDGSELTGLSAGNPAISAKTGNGAGAGVALALGVNVLTLGSDAHHVFRLPSSALAGDRIWIKNPSNATGARTANITGSLANPNTVTVDGVASIRLESADAAVCLVYVGSNAWKVF